MAWDRAVGLAVQRTSSLGAQYHRANDPMNSSSAATRGPAAMQHSWVLESPRDDFGAGI